MQPGAIDVVNSAVRHDRHLAGELVAEIAVHDTGIACEEVSRSGTTVWTLHWITPWSIRVTA
jgi:hypothetical protein